MVDCIGHIFGPSWAVGTDMLRCERCGLSYADRLKELDDAEGGQAMTEQSHSPTGDDVERVARALHAEMLDMEAEGDGCRWNELSEEQLAMLDSLARAAIATLSPNGVSQSAVERLTAERDKLQRELDEETAWDAVVDKVGGLDQFDALADQWVAREPIKRMVRATTSVFSKWANDDLMTRYHGAVENIVHQAFVEGAAVGARAALATHDTGLREADQTTYSLHHNPNCPKPFLVRLPRGALDLKAYAETNDACGFGMTFAEAFSNARATLETTSDDGGSKL